MFDPVPLVHVPTVPGMWRYFKRIYQRFALESDRYITGKFEFGDMNPTANHQIVAAGMGGLGEVRASACVLYGRAHLLLC